MANTMHVDYKHSGVGQNVTYSGSAGASVQSSALGAQTYWIRVSAVGAITATNAGVHFQVGDNPTASATSPLLPLNWVETVKANPGQKVAVLGDGTVAGTFNIQELTD